MRALFSGPLAAFVILWSLATASCARTPPPQAERPPVQVPLPEVGTNTLLDEHNKYRAEVGVPPLRWSVGLAISAQHWADYLATTVHRLHESATPGIGENLAMCTVGYKTAAQLVDLWGQEKTYFVEGTFPSVSTLGEWRPIAHYSQMIWRRTTEVGCGSATDGRNDYLVCQYSPPGNVMEQNVF
jgi:hypothetical protein